MNRYDRSVAGAEFRCISFVRLGAPIEPSWSHLGAILSHLGALLGPSGGHLGPSWSSPGLPGGFINRYDRKAVGAEFRDIFFAPYGGALGAFLAPSRGHLGPSWGHLGALGAFLGPSWAILGPSWGSWGLLGARVLGEIVGFPIFTNMEWTILRHSLPLFDEGVRVESKKNPFEKKAKIVWRSGHGKQP